MEQHPVPRNITGFQFHLIGDMTLKQFGYLLAGVVIGYIFIRLPFPTFISWPIGLGSALAGIALAFLPIQERPLDRWLVAFIKSVYSPTQFVWRKENNPPAILLTHLPKQRQPTEKLSRREASIYLESRQKLKAYLATLPKNPREAVDTEEVKRLTSTLLLFNHPVTVSTMRKAKPWPASPITAVETLISKVTSSTRQAKEQPGLAVKKPIHFDFEFIPKEPLIPRRQIEPETIKKAEEEKRVETIANQTQELTAQISPPAKQLEQKEVDKQRLLKLEQQLSQLLSEKDRLGSELTTLRQKAAEKEKKEVVRPTVFKEEKEKETVKIISPKVAKTAGFPSIPQVPNIISGIVKDSKGTLLPNILVTIRDQGSTPLRALKTNKLGQFAASTPLPKGTYTIEFEDRLKRYRFVTIEISLTDDLVTPLEILGKGEKEFHREKLMRQIFGQTV